MNHPYSELSKAPLSKRRTATALTVGDLVYLHTDRNKSCARHRYLVASVDGNWCNVRKFVGAQLRSSSYRVKSSECYKVAACSTDLSRTPPRIADEILSGDDEEIVLPPSRPPCTSAILDIPAEISTPALPYGASLDDSQQLNAVDYHEPDDDRHDTTPPLAAPDDLRDFTPPRRSSRPRRAPQCYNDYLKKLFTRNDLRSMPLRYNYYLTDC